MPAPIVCLSYVYELSLLLRIASTLLLVFGIIDLGVFLCYHDRINDMVIFEGQDRRIPKGCLTHQ